MVHERINHSRLIGKSPSFVEETRKIPDLARCDVTVLISGTTGSGKEMFARAIHSLSPRADKPFVPVNCGAIPADLIENELFGHVEGAFTNASSSQGGLICEADGGTLFLDEINCLSLKSQVKILRFLQEKEYRRLGSPKTIQANVRVIAATNIDLTFAREEGRFRDDLFYRLNIVSVSLPKLTDRLEDIPLLAEHFLARYASEFDRPVKHLSDEVVRKLVLYGWPGNVRELEHIIAGAVVFCDREILREDDIHLPEQKHIPSLETFRSLKSRVVGKFERDYINALLHTFGGNITRAARVAGKNRRAFWELIRKHRIDMNEYRSIPQKSWDDKSRETG